MGIGEIGVFPQFANDCVGLGVGEAIVDLILQTLKAAFIHLWLGNVLGGVVVAYLNAVVGLEVASVFGSAADQQYGEWLKKNDKVVYRGYIRWAKTVTAWMDGTGPNFMFWVNKEERNQKQKEATTKWAYKIATPWSEHMAYLMGAVKNDNEVGKILMNIGRPICKFVFSLPKKYKLGLFGSWMMWFLCLGSFFCAKSIVKTSKLIDKIKLIIAFITGTVIRALVQLVLCCIHF